MTRTEMLLATVELRALADRYAMAVDRGDGALFAAQFTEDGRLEAPRGVFRGRAALATVPAMMQRLYDRTHHAVVGQVATFDGDDDAGAETYALARHYARADAEGELCYEMTIRYEDRFARIDGAWLLARRRLVLVGEATFPCDGRPAGAEKP